MSLPRSLPLVQAWHLTWVRWTGFSVPAKSEGLRGPSRSSVTQATLVTRWCLCPQPGATWLPGTVVPPPPRTRSGPLDSKVNLSLRSSQGLVCLHVAHAPSHALGTLSGRPRTPMQSPWLLLPVLRGEEGTKATRSPWTPWSQKAFPLGCWGHESTAEGWVSFICPAAPPQALLCTLLPLPFVFIFSVSKSFVARRRKQRRPLCVE